MTTATVQYNGSLRTTCTHTRSGTQIHTDAPVDNNGKGESFSPTDLMSLSLVACMFTIMGITAEKENIPFKSAEAEMEKIMAENPRRVSKIIITINLNGKNLTSEQKELLETSAKNCPVAKSIHPEILQDISFNYS